jgi:CheY-like chemotaxis protein
LPYGARIVEIFGRAAAANPARKVIVGDFIADRGNQVAQTLEKMGYQTIVVPTGRELLRRLGKAADIDLVLVDSGIPDPPLPYLLAELRADVNYGLVPVFVTMAPDRAGKLPLEARLLDLVRGYRNVWVIATALEEKTLKEEITRNLAGSMAPPLTEEERKGNAALAVLWLRRMAQGELPGYDVRPAEEGILAATRSPELAPLAIEAAGGIPTRQAQRSLADVVLGNARSELRSEAAIELARHVRQNGLLLEPPLVRGVEELHQTTKDAKLRGAVALVLGSFDPSAHVTGTRLEKYHPQFAPAAKPAEPKEK